MPKNEFELISGLKLNKKIGSGVDGKVYSIKKYPKLIVKEQSYKAYKRELPIAIYLSNKNIIPKIRGVYKGDKKGYIIQDRYDGILANIINGKIVRLPGIVNGNLNKRSRQSLRNAVRKMHRAGVIHMNLHNDNIVYKRTPTGLQFKVIDAGAAVKLNKTLTTPKMVKSVMTKIIGNNYHKKRIIGRELQFYKGFPPPPQDYTPSQRQLKLFKGI